MDATQSVPTVDPAGAQIRKIPPPSYYLAAFVAGRGLELAVHWPKSTGGWYAVAGGLTLASGVVLGAAAIAGFVTHRTTIVPHRPVREMVTTGAYAMSRNPMYTGLAAAYVGLVLLTDSWWPLATLPVALAGIQAWVIGPEEAYLQRRSPVEFAEYRSRVRRWL